MYVYVTLCSLACILCVSSASSQRLSAMILNPQKMYNKIETHMQSESWIRGVCFHEPHAIRRIWQANPLGRWRRREPMNDSMALQSLAPAVKATPNDAQEISVCFTPYSAEDAVLEVQQKNSTVTRYEHRQRLRWKKQAGIFMGFICAD